MYLYVIGDILEMNRYFGIFIIIFGLFLSLNSCVPYEIKTTHIPFSIGDSTVYLVLHESAAPGLTYLNVHDDENTCIQAALYMIRQNGGRLLQTETLRYTEYHIYT